MNTWAAAGRALPTVLFSGGAGLEVTGSQKPMQPGSRALVPTTEPIEILYGLRAGLSVFEHRRQDIRRVGFQTSVRSEVQELARWAAAASVPCKEETEKELTNRCQSNQHEGLVLGVRPRAWLPPKDLAAWLIANHGSAIALDRVRNPQNIGAILRSAAFFGTGAAILGTPAPHPGLPPFALRVAEGGAEHLRFTRTTDLADTLARMKATGVFIIGADTRSKVDPASLLLRSPHVLVLGNEREGLHPRVKAQCDALVGIQGSGAIESLNVGVAAGVLLGELWRKRARTPLSPESREL